MQQSCETTGKHVKPTNGRRRRTKPKGPTMTKTDLKFEAMGTNGRMTTRKVYEDEQGQKFVRVLTKYIPVGQYARKFSRSQFVSTD